MWRFSCFNLYLFAASTPIGKPLYVWYGSLKAEGKTLHLDASRAPSAPKEV